MNLLQRQSIREQRVVGGAGGVGDVGGEVLSAPAAARVARVPSMRLTVSSIRSYRPTPLPASVRATAQPFFSPHSPAVPIAPYTPRDPDDGPSTRQGVAWLKLSGICTAIVTRFLPLPSSSEGEVLAAGDQALARGDDAVRVDVGAVERAVAAGRRRIEDGAVVGVEGVPAQLERGRIERVGIGRCRCRAEAGLAEAAGEQVLRCRGRAASGRRRRVDADAVLRHAARQIVGGDEVVAAASGEQAAGDGDRARGPGGRAE